MITKTESKVIEKFNEFREYADKILDHGKAGGCIIHDERKGNCNGCTFSKRDCCILCQELHI